MLENSVVIAKVTLVKTPECSVMASVSVIVCRGWNTPVSAPKDAALERMVDSKVPEQWITVCSEFHSKVSQNV